LLNIQTILESAKFVLKYSNFWNALYAIPKNKIWHSVHLKFLK